MQRSRGVRKVQRKPRKIQFGRNVIVREEAAPVPGTRVKEEKSEPGSLPSREAGNGHAAEMAKLGLSNDDVKLWRAACAVECSLSHEELATIIKVGTSQPHHRACTILVLGHCLASAGHSGRFLQQSIFPVVFSDHRWTHFPDAVIAQVKCCLKHQHHPPNHAAAIFIALRHPRLSMETMDPVLMLHSRSPGWPFPFVSQQHMHLSRDTILTCDTPQKRLNILYHISCKYQDSTACISL